MKIKRYIAVVLFLILGIYSCIEPFAPEVSEKGSGYLVVDGFLNIGNDTNYLQLSRTLNIQDNSQNYEGVDHCTVVVHSDDGKTYSYEDMGNGRYRLPPQHFDLRAKYSLSITTYEGKQYQSELVSVSTTPDIDSISYRVDEHLGSVVINVNTHDPENKTWFYRWNFQETHRYSVPHYSFLEWTGVGGKMVPRDERTVICWKTESSKHILLGSTVKQSQSSVISLPINNILISTNKFLEGYSILVRQYGLTHEAFEYWTTLAKTTQGTGSLFDPLPSLVTGNIKNISDNTDLVFGYFSAGEEKTKRLFISQRLGAYKICPFPIDTINLSRPLDLQRLPGAAIIDYTDETMSAVYATVPTCADCRLQGGNTIKPSFWP